MTHTHHDEEAELSRAELVRRRRALRIMVVVLIPLGIWTLAGLIALWPKDVADHVNPEIGYSVAGVTFPTARITHIEETSCAGLPGSTEDSSKQVCANIEVQLLEGDEVGKSVTVPLTAELYGSGTEVGQHIKLVRIPPIDGQPAQYQFSDFERRVPLLVLTLAFAAAVVFVARWRGFASLLGLGFAFFILVEFMFPALVLGTNPILVGLIGSSAIMFVVLYAAHGFSARTTTALLGTLFGLLMIAFMGWVATRWAHLTGVSSEDDYILSAAAPELQLTSVVMCGIIVAGLGVLNDVTITQASAVWELASSDTDQRRLFSRAMRIGRDHIASTVYTIAFATAGAVLPVLLLIAIYDRPLFEVVQTEQFADEIVRTLVGSIGLILAMPLTTAVAVAVVRASGRSTAPVRVGARTSTDARPGGRFATLIGRIPLGPLRKQSAAEAGADDENAELTLAGDPVHSGGGGHGDEIAGASGVGDSADEAADRAGGAQDAAAARPDAVTPAARTRRWRRQTEDDFGDFSDLRDPEAPSSPSRRD